MKALVFGGAGQLGQALEAKAGDGCKIVAVDRSKCDISDERATKAMIARSDCDIVINAAAYTAVDKAESERKLAQRINGDAPGWIAQECAASNKALVHISSDLVFGEGHQEPIKPDTKPSPISVYGATKLAGELAAQAALPDVLIIRTSRVYATKGANFVLTMLRLMAGQDELGVVADQIGSPTAAGDLADAVIRFADAGAMGIYHFTNEGMCSWHEFAIAIAEESVAVGLLEKHPIITAVPTSFYPTPARRPTYSVLDKQTAWGVLGGPARHWRVALREVILEIQENG